MDLLQRTFRQFLELWQGMSPSQRGTLVVVPLLVVAGFGWLIAQRNDGGMTALSWGKVYSTEELIQAEQALIQDGLTGFRREGQRLMVPSHEIDRYNAALVKYDALPSDLGAQLLKKYESLGPFSTEKERQELREAMLLQELRRMIRAIPDIEDARVGVANSGRRSWSHPNRVTANVSVRTRAGRELSNKLVQSIRAAVASMVPDLKPADVTVFDLVNGVSHTGESADDPFDSRLVHRIREFQRQYQDQILQDLSYIPDVGVTVNVDVDNLKSSVIRNQVVDPKKIAALYTTESSVTDAQQQRTPRGEAGQVANRPGSVAAQSGSDRTRTLTETDNQQVNGVSFEVAEKELIAAMPKAVQVSVAIPRDYYRSVAAQRKAAGEQDPAQLDVAAIEKDVLARVTKSVKALIPADSPPTAVIVNSIDRVTTPLVDTALPWSERAFEMVREWGGTGVLVLFAAMALVMLKQTVPPLPATPPVELGPLALKSAVAAESDAEESSPKPATRRDRLQSLVRDNPEATAAIIQKWIAAAK